MKPTVLLLALALAASPCLAAEPERDQPAEHKTYESPILSLLFLPANVLIKIASVFAPRDGSRSKTETSEPRNGSSR